jgi:putative hydrolase of the HAD superfamily
VAFLPAADRILDGARQVGRVGVLTNGPRDRQEPKIRALGLAERVDEVVYAGDLPRRKPHVDPFETILSGLDVDAERSLYVGDSLAYDVAGAQNAGLAVAWLRGDADDDPGAYRPEYTIDSLAELADIFEE